MYSIKFNPSALKEFKKLEKKIQNQISTKIDKLVVNPDSLKPEKLKGSETFFRIRSGDYRIVYEIIEDRVLILVIKIGHRREVYKGF